MKLRASVSSKTKLSATLKSWLPILQSNISDLEDTLGEYVQTNPYVDVRSNIQGDFSSKLPKKTFDKKTKNSITDKIESLTIGEKTLYDVLYEQINAPLFPTQKSQDIAYKIVENINEDGYFDGDEEELSEILGVKVEEFEKVRLRFAYIDPSGIGAKNVKESFSFQLESADVEDKLYDVVLFLLENMENINKHREVELFREAIKVIQSFKSPPSIEYFEKEQNVIPDIFVYEIDGQIEINLNDKYYPQISIETTGVDKGSEFVRLKIKEAKDLIDALEMRKATLYKIGLMIVEYQYDYFRGGEIKPMKLKDLAEEFGHAPSTISRAIAGKYIECNRGVVALKSFFTTALDEDLSNSSIKNYIEETVKSENKLKPLSDIKILAMVEEKFNIKMVRRTITKYRKQLNIASSSERKKLYELSVSE